MRKTNFMSRGMHPVDETVKAANMSGRVELRAVVDREAGLRLDRWFQRHFPELSHGALQKLLRTGQVRIDGRRAEGKDRVEAGQTIRLPPGVTASPADTIAPFHTMGPWPIPTLNTAILLTSGVTLTIAACPT